MKRWTEKVNRYSIDITDNQTGKMFIMKDKDIMNMFPKFKHQIQYGYWSISLDAMDFLGIGIIQEEEKKFQEMIREVKFHRNIRSREEIEL